MPEHQNLLQEAIRTEGEGQRLLLEGNAAAGRRRLHDAAELYRRSWEAAPPRSFGRLVGMLKAEVIAGDARKAAGYARDQLPETPDSPTSWYAAGIAALVDGDDELARRAAGGMREGSAEFDRAAAAIEALANRDESAYAAAVEAIVADFEARTGHLTGVAIADTALMLERLAAARGMAAEISSPLLPRTAE